MATPDLWDPLQGLSEEQRALLRNYERLLAAANRKRNLVSKASAREIHDRHIVHSLGIAMRDFPPGSQIVDWGTGGGLPGIPLAIRFPDATFHLVDSIYKKTWTVEQFKLELGLSNVVVHQLRAEDWSVPVDYAVSRATADLKTLWRWSAPHLPNQTPEPAATVWRPGLIALKGGDVSTEVSGLRLADPAISVERIDLNSTMASQNLEAKCLIHVVARVRT